jgi:hypothetical protein
MSVAFAKNQNVRVVVSAPSGRVVNFRISEDGEMFYLIEWSTESGSEQRWFREDELEIAD